jgi:hypothetical protein
MKVSNNKTHVAPKYGSSPGSKANACYAEEGKVGAKVYHGAPGKDSVAPKARSLSPGQCTNSDTVKLV